MNGDAFDFFVKGGIFMIPLLLCSLISLMIIIERGLALRRTEVISPMLSAAIESLTHRAQARSLAEIVTTDKSSLSRLVAAALNHIERPKPENMDSVQMQARHEILLLERGLVILEIIVGVAPLLGLLGTVSGLVTIFGGMDAKGIASQGMAIARGISEALNTTVAGLVIAIPSLTFWAYYTKKIETLAAEMEALCGELLTKLYRDSGDEPAAGKA